MSEERTIARMRERAGLTQSELAQLIGVSENTIANWEKGGASKWIRHLQALCRVLNCNLEDLESKHKSQENTHKSLTPNIIETIKSYCTALLNGDKKAVSKISSFATLHDNLLRYWLDQVDEIINQFKQKPEENINCEIIVNTLVLQELNMQLSYDLPNKFKFEDFCSLLEKIELSYEFLNRYISFKKDRFSRKLILQTRYLSVYVISWEPGQMSLMHHHGNSLDAIWVIKGEMTHWLLSQEKCEIEKIPFEGCTLEQKYLGEEKSKTFLEGNWVFIDRRYAHQIENSSNTGLVTLHFRFGAPPDDDKWEDTEEQPVIIWHQMEQYQVMPA
jgi:transcriptional regulator with XRE-family HTH domain